jgi:hypothetical protein
LLPKLVFPVLIMQISFLSRKTRNPCLTVWRPY